MANRPSNLCTVFKQFSSNFLSTTVGIYNRILRFVYRLRNISAYARPESGVSCEPGVPEASDGHIVVFYRVIRLWFKGS